MRDTIMLNSVPFTIASGKHGERLWSVSQRAGQPGDPGDMKVIPWRVDGPDFFSFERIPQGAETGYLGRDYGLNTDGRNLGLDTLGPEINSLSLGTYDNTLAGSVLGTSTAVPGTTLHFGPAFTLENTHGMAQITGPAGVPFGYFIRGNNIAKVRLDTMALVLTNGVFDEPATSIIATRAANNTREISVGMNGAAYQVATTIAAAGSSDTWAANTGSNVVRIFGEATDRIVGLDGQRARGNILTGSVTMAAPNWATVAARIGDDVLTMTGFALDGRLWIVGTSDGPYILDQDTGEFFPLIREIDNDSETCRLLTSWFPVGVLFNLRYGFRWLKGGRGASIGPGEFQHNTSPVQGRVLAFDGSAHEALMSIYDEVNDNSYLVFWCPPHPDDPVEYQHYPLVPFTVARLQGLVCRLIKHIGTVNGARTSPTWVAGGDSDLRWLISGRYTRQIDDTAYRYGTSGTTFLTETRRFPGMILDVEKVEFHTANLTANRTVRVGIQLDGGTVEQFAAVTSGTFQRQFAASAAGVPTAGFLGGRRLKPPIVYASNVNTAAPQVTGVLSVYVRLRLPVVRVIEATLINREDAARTPDDQTDALLTALRAGPVELQDPDGDTFYVKVEAVPWDEAEDRGGGETSARGSVRTTKVRMVEWAPSG